MKFFGIVISVIIMTTEIVNAEYLSQDSTSFSNQSVVGISNLIYAFMQDCEHIKQEYDSTLSDSEKIGMELFKETYLYDSSNSDNPDTNLVSIKSFLSNSENGWNIQANKIFNELFKNYKNEIELKSYDLEELVSINDSLRKVYISKIDSFIIPSENWNWVCAEIIGSSQQVPLSPTIVDNYNDQLPKSKIDRTRKPISVLIVNFFNKYIKYILFVALGIIIFYWMSKRKIESILKIEKSKYKDEIRGSDDSFLYGYFGLIEVLLKHKNMYRDDSQNEDNNIKIESLIRENSELNAKVEDLEIKYKQITEKDIRKDERDFHPSPFDNIGLDTTKADSLENKLSTRYFGIPEKDGSLLDELGTLSPAPRSYYKIEFQKDSDFGKLHYRSGDLDTSAISQMDFILEPVCDIENAFIVNPISISVISDGEVIRAQNKWVIKEKIIIKLN